MALRRIAGERARDDAAQRVVDLRRQILAHDQRFMQDAVDRPVRVPLSHQGLAGQHLCQHHAGREHVHGSGHRTALGHFRRHVAGRSGGGLLAVLAAGILQRRGNSEVHDAGPAGVVHQNVGRLDVPVDHAGSMGHGQGIQHIGHQVGRLDRRHGALAGQQVREGLAGDILEHQIRLQVLDIRLEHRDDVRMRQPTHMAGFLQPLRDRRNAGAVAHPDELDGDFAFQPGVKTQPDYRLRTLAQDAPQLETAQLRGLRRLGPPGGPSANGGMWR